VTLILALSIALWPSTAHGHDPSAWGGLFRTRDGGATWLTLNSGSFVSGAIALAVSPTDPNHLLLATDSGVLASRNGGRDWTVQAPDVVIGAAFAVAYDSDGSRALASGASAIYRADGDRWHLIQAPPRATPARALARGTTPGRVYLAGWSGLYRSDDWGESWVRADAGMPEEHIDALVIDPGPSEVVYVIAGRRLWVGVDGARYWEPRQIGPPLGHAEAVALDGFDPTRLWAVVSGQLFRSDDRGEHWEPVGRPLPELDTRVRGVGVAGSSVLMATDRGVYRSPDGGDRWEAPSNALPAHLEAGPLVRDPLSASTMYVGFASTPYAELWRRAAEGRSALARLDAVTLAGGAAFLALLTLGAVATLRRLAHFYDRASLKQTSSRPAVPAPEQHKAS
jgi:photosystem II stability/assembly factor-like uncharacterized protein